MTCCFPMVREKGLGCGRPSGNLDRPLRGQAGLDGEIEGKEARRICLSM